MFLDGDVLVRHDLDKLFKLADPTKAVMVVQHDYINTDLFKKVDQIQSSYLRKNWSSVMLFNLQHPANKNMNIYYLNHAPGLELQQFGWLQDNEIGELPLGFNWLVGISPPIYDPAIVHYTLGTPDLPGHEDDPYADEWKAVRDNISD